METSDARLWTVEQVGNWLEEKGFSSHIQAFLDNDVDGETLVKMTENMVARLLPTIKLQVKFLELQAVLKSAPISPQETLSASNSTAPQPAFDSSASEQCGQQLSQSTYILPDFPLPIKTLLGTKLRSHFMPGTSNRASIVETLVDDLIHRNIWYPSRTSYNVVVSTLAVKYPFLLDADGTSNSWKNSVKARMKRHRPHLVSDATVQAMRAKYGRPDVSGRKRKALEPVADEPQTKVPRFKLSDVDLALVGEDQHSIDKNVAAIVAEWKKAHPDERILVDKMKRTAPYRQKMCLEQPSSVVLENFPCLQNHAFLTADALSLYDINTARICSITEMENGLTRCAERKYSRGKERDQLKSLVQNHALKMEETLEQSIREDLRVKFGLELLILCLGESAALLSVPTAQDVSDPVPCIIATDSKWSVYFDNMCLLSNLNSFSKAVECWFSIFFNFQVKYPSSLANTCLFIEKYLCRHHVPVPSFVKRLANKVIS